jgi:DnaJ-class molecular chaperone
MKNVIKKESDFVIKDYYKILNVNKKASTLKIKKTFRKLVKELHPDVKKSKTTRDDFVEIIEAYEVLSHRIKRIQYDKLYDFLILKKEVKGYNKKHDTWENHIEKSIEKSQRKAKKYTSDSPKKFRNRVKKWKLGFIFDLFLEFIWWLFRALIEGIIFGA